MLVTSYEYAHQIVDSNKNLSWDGWNILEVKESLSAEYKPDGKLINGKWHYVKSFNLTENGWEVPTKYVRSRVDSKS